MPERLPATLTPITAPALAASLRAAWPSVFPGEPSPSTIRCLLAQSAFESGRWARCICYGLAGIKSTPTDGHSWTFYATTEVLPAATVAHFRIAPRTDGPGDDCVQVPSPDGKAHVHLYPDNPGARFRAYATLDEAAVDYLHTLATTFKSVVPALVAGDPAAYANALKASGYFTGDLSAYTAGLVSLFHEFARTGIGDAPIVTDADRAQTAALVAETLTAAPTERGE